MFLKSLTISFDSVIIREVLFRKGINLIVDESREQITGNNVGKTTVLKLIDFCLGGDPKNIYLDPESKSAEYQLVKKYLIDNNVLITLVLIENIDDSNSTQIVIERNFLPRSKMIRRINGEDLTEDEYEKKMVRLIFPGHFAHKPSFRQIISHNIRYKDESINNTLKTLDKYTSNAEYETLYLFLFGCDFTRGNVKQELLLNIKQEDNYRKRLEKQHTKTAYEATLSLINNEIEELNTKKLNLNLNENFEADLDKLNNLKYKINKTSSEISKLNIRKDLIEEAKVQLKSDTSKIEIEQLKSIYQQATSFINNIHRTFTDMVQFHNRMIIEKIKYITKELPALERNIESKREYLSGLLKEENELSMLISKSDTFEELENLISELNDRYKKKGEYENIIQQLEDVEKNIKDYNKELEEIDNELLSEKFEHTVKRQLEKFNIHFASISNILYGEKYALKYDIISNSKNQKLYKFSAFNTNLSSGKKQGEISCFDIAYTLFADEENIPCLHFLLNDKKELMHDNQLVKISDLVNKDKIQFVASILRDKLPTELNNEDYFILKLSQDDKLFRIEKYK